MKYNNYKDDALTGELISGILTHYKLYKKGDKVEQANFEYLSNKFSDLN
jgi:hypothetical protein